MASQMPTLAALLAHAPFSGDDGAFLVVHWDAVAVVVCCAVLLWWWVRDQNARRCPDCGYAPMWCRCPHPHPPAQHQHLSHRHRDHEH